ncbi:MAG: winged helix-turn-helix domain-containing protein [Candidatus Bathyarchaeota archaeon]
MRRSELEMYIDVLRVLTHHGPLKLTHIMYKANINCSVLKEFMDFLIKHDLIEERTIGKKRVVYAITQKGRSVIKVFREIEKILPVEEEGRTKIPIPY